MLCKALNAAYNCNAERQTLSSYFRVPGSINEKSSDRIEIMKISPERYTVQELMDEYLPVYVKKEKMLKKEQHRRATYKSMCITLQTDRIDYYKKARRIPGITRELHRAKFEKEVMDAIKNGPIDKKSLAKKMNVSARTITRYLNTVLEKIGNTKSSKSPKMAAIISSIKALIKEPCEKTSENEKPAYIWYPLTDHSGNKSGLFYLHGPTQ